MSPPRVIPNREDTIYTIYLSTVFTCPGPAINGGWWLPAGSGAQITHFQTPFYVISRGWSPVLHCSEILRHSTIQSVHCLDTLDTVDTEDASAVFSNFDIVDTLVRKHQLCINK